MMRLIIIIFIAHKVISIAHNDKFDYVIDTAMFIAHHNIDRLKDVID